MKGNILLCLTVTVSVIFSFFFGYLYTIHNLDIRCDHPQKQIYVTDQFNQTWVYDYNYTELNPV